ncbi:hypothetical protein COV11_00660 [Candidatus Woesearchaeota archaeon CG10_big_fil_rev_8_21_14_0_10_30_7]|nr:MAG: hypothetical protein COV11_00660 [Candidatus Woesearchaeota archaeon CG10_big_fil_rev_8_21_14_0_10_30_7]
MAELVIIPALILGALIGALETFFMAKDVQSSYHFISHATHAFVYALIAVFAVMNIEYVLSLIPALKTVPYLSNHWVFRGVMGLIGMIKIHAASLTIPKGAPKSMKETWTHSIIIAALIIASPEIWSVLAPVLPWKLT